MTARVDPVRLLLACLAALSIAAPAAAVEKRIALSFDDVPRSPGAFFTPDQRTVKLIAALHRAGVRQAAFFVVPGNLALPQGAGGEDRIAAYVAAGHVIGNHSFSHRHLSEMSAADYLADIDRAQAWLKGREGDRMWFRFPFLDEGGDDKAKIAAVRAGLKARGLANGYVTADGSDWHLDDLANAAIRAGRPVDMAGLRDLYVSTMVGGSDYGDALARRALGRAPVQVLLLHETDLAALFIEDLVRALRKDGWTIVTADRAFADPISRAEPDVPDLKGTRIEMMAWQKGVPAPRWYDRNDGAVADRLFAERVLHQASLDPASLSPPAALPVPPPSTPPVGAVKARP